MMVLAIGIFLINLFTFLDLSIGNRKLLRLASVPLGNETLPKVSIIIAAKDEEISIEKCVESLFQLDYPDYELIVVNDRSTDKTGEILSALSQRYPQLVVETIHELPKGWLGKNHALVHGARRAKGEWLLLTDGDVIFERSALRRAVSLAERNKRDHLPVMPHILEGSFWYNLALPIFVFYFLSYMRPWAAKNPKSKSYMGVGGFNLVRRSVYERVGTHEKIKLRPDEDVRLGELLKRAGASQEAVTGKEMAKVQWYFTFRELCVGLEKNVLAGIDYRSGMLFLLLIAGFLFHIFPFVALFTTAGTTFQVFLATFVLQLIGMWDLDRFYLNRPQGVPLFPLGVALYLFVIVRAVTITLSKGGVEWRGTFYSLDELKGKSGSPQNPSSR